MIGLGIFLFFIGLAGIEEGGILLVIAGIILFIIGIAKKETNQNTGDSINVLNNKINLIENFYITLLKACVEQKKIDEYKNIIKFFEQLKQIVSNLNYKGVDIINNEYDRIIKIYDDLFEKIKEKYEILDDSSFDFSYSNLENIIKSSKNDLEKLINTDNLINYLLLSSDKLSVSKNGYSNFETSNIGLPNDPKKIHLYAMTCFITKTIIDGNNIPLFNSLCELLNNIEDKAELRKLLRKLYKEKLYNLKKMYEKDEEDNVLDIILFIDPSSTEQYDKNNKFYEKLGLSKDATKEEIDKAYKKILLLSHPDRGGDVQEWSKINEAYTKIKDLKSIK